MNLSSSTSSSDPGFIGVESLGSHSAIFLAVEAKQPRLPPRTILRHLRRLTVKQALSPSWRKEPVLMESDPREGIEPYVTVAAGQHFEATFCCQWTTAMRFLC